MEESDKQRLRAAFDVALSKNPAADQPLPGVTKQGQPVTLREYVNTAILDEEFFQKIEASRQTVDWWARKIEAGTLQIFPGPGIGA